MTPIPEAELTACGQRADNHSFLYLHTVGEDNTTCKFFKSENSTSTTCLQLENEYGFIGNADDKHYMRHLVKLARKALGDEIVLFTTDPPPNVEKGSLPDEEIFR